MARTAGVSPIKAAETALAASSDRVVIVSHAGLRYVAKRTALRPRSRRHAVLVRWLVWWITGQSLPLTSLRLSQAASSVDFEANRLLALARAGQRVPQLVHQGADYLLLEDCGPTVDSLLEDWPINTCHVELHREARELGAFHRAGHWHGAAQIKNLTRKDGHTWRIDFEENFGEFVPLPVAQALDIVLFLNSASLVGPLNEAESRRLLPLLLDTCLAENPDPRVRETLVRALPWLKSLAWLSAPLRGRTVKGRERKGATRLALLAETLSSVLESR
jgi:hypothetical protein